MGMKIRAFELPLALDGVLITQAWHPRHQMAPAHQWLRRAILSDRRRPGRPGPLPRAETAGHPPGLCVASPRLERRGTCMRGAHCWRAKSRLLRAGRLREPIAATEATEHVHGTGYAAAIPGLAGRRLAPWTLLQRLDIATPRAYVARSLLAAALALGVAYLLELESPYSAASTVLLVINLNQGAVIGRHGASSAR